MLSIVSRPELRWSIVWGWWFSLNFSRWTSFPFGMWIKCIMDTFIMGVRSVWSEGWVFIMHIWCWRWHLLLRKVICADWTNYLHWVVECAVIESLSFLRLTRKWIERCLL